MKELTDNNLIVSAPAKLRFAEKLSIAQVLHNFVVQEIILDCASNRVQKITGNSRLRSSRVRQQSRAYSIEIFRPLYFGITIFSIPFSKSVLILLISFGSVISTRVSSLPNSMSSCIFLPNSRLSGMTRSP
ncbi:MAG: hypothetical protein DNFNHJIP_00299 [Candidatus Argoarchaeum ethanivorans]|uniref:Uncharacterized protein n=1 Tax=Candidatus Argoarchaeum ethanivorans TaxID=2608793 RepID=A0A812A050_9EURY|nr:MAG: hypothetical protein DNFNHJIP_00299 [Candidatus Argoarchaeum ethanivorans]